MTTASGSTRLPIFPLPSVVLFPTLSVPLYIFEPRYRAMTRAALEGNRRIGMVTIRPEAVDSMAGDPEVFSVGCEGEIGRARPRPDGTLDILLVATRRFEIVEEPARSDPYRSALVEPLEEEAWDRDSPEIATARRSIGASLGTLSGQGPPGVPERPNERHADRLEALAALADERFVHVVAQAVDLGVGEKQRLLEAPGVAPRYRLLDAFLRFRVAELGANPAPGPETLQ